jgi:hypothetical protein
MIKCEHFIIPVEIVRGNIVNGLSLEGCTAVKMSSVVARSDNGNLTYQGLYNGCVCACVFVRVWSCVCVCVWRVGVSWACVDAYQA